MCVSFVKVDDTRNEQTHLEKPKVIYTYGPFVWRSNLNYVNELYKHIIRWTNNVRKIKCFA